MHACNCQQEFRNTSHEIEYGSYLPFISTLIKAVFLNLFLPIAYLKSDKEYRGTLGKIKKGCICK